MSQVFMFDDLLVSINLNQDLTGATGLKILYIKPDGTRGEWVATISGTSLVYNATNGEIDQPGQWQFEARLRLNGKKTSGVSTQYVDKPLDV